MTDEVQDMEKKDVSSDVEEFQEKQENGEQEFWNGSNRRRSGDRRRFSYRFGSRERRSGMDRRKKPPQHK